MNRASSLSAPVGAVPLPPRPLMTSEVLDAAFRLFRAGLVRCLPYSGLTVLVLELPTLYSTFQGTGDVAFGLATPLSGLVPFSGLTDNHIVLLISLLLGAALLGMISLRLASIARGARPSFRAEVATALLRWPAASIVTFVALIFPGLLYMVISLFNPMFPNPVLLMAAALLLLPSGLFVVALPAFWSDGLGSFAAVGQTVRVSLRSLLRMVGAILATMCIVVVLYLLTAVLLAIVSPLLGRADLFLIATVRLLADLVFGAIGVPFVVSVLIVAYADLKLRDQQRRGALP
jgi:hypothetical protein